MRPAISRFVDQMEAELDKHTDEKGGDNWRGTRVGALSKELAKQIRIMGDALFQRDDEEIRKRAAHVANFAMMIHDNLTMNGKKTADES